jgi:hypothetical protein
MNYTNEITSGGIIRIPGFITIGSGIREMLRLLYQQFEGLSDAITVVEWNF